MHTKELIRVLQDQSVCLYIYGRGRNFYPIVTKFGMGLIKSKVMFEDGLCGSHSGEMTFLQSFMNLKMHIQYKLELYGSHRSGKTFLPNFV